MWLIVVPEYIRDSVPSVDEEALLLLFLGNGVFPVDTSLRRKGVLRTQR